MTLSEYQINTVLDQWRATELLVEVLDAADITFILTDLERQAYGIYREKPFELARIRLQYAMLSAILQHKQLGLIR